MPQLGFQELMVILLIVIVIFGANKIPQLGKGLGEGIKNFKASMREAQQEPEKKEPEKKEPEKKEKQTA
jgi:sec-independent protein translocase protein TatA